MRCRTALLELARSPPEFEIPHAAVHLSLGLVGSVVQALRAQMMAAQAQMVM
jgi:hypothetical protein